MRYYYDLHDLPERYITDTLNKLLRDDLAAEIASAPEVSEFLHRHWEKFVHVVATDQICNSPAIASMILRYQQKLHDLPERHIVDTLNKLLRDDLAAEIASAPEVSEFLIKHWHTVIHAIPTDRICNSTAIAAMILRYPQESLDLFEEADLQPGLTASVITMAKFAVAERAHLSGTTLFSSLTAEDLYLGECYQGNSRYKPSEFHRNRDAWEWERILARLDQGGDMGSVEALPFPYGNKSGTLANTYRVEALQPRIAELAFKRLYPIIYGKPVDALIDLNLESLLSGDRLPGEDWQDAENQFDVKSNLYFRSRKSKIGLNGFLINLNKEIASRALLPGFVFWDTNDNQSSWSFIGILRPELVNQAGERVSPYWFEMPDTCRLRCTLSQNQVDVLTEIVCKLNTKKSSTSTCHPLIPWLAGGSPSMLPKSMSTVQKRAAEQILETKGKLSQLRPKNSDMPLEQLMWQATTDAVFNIRNHGLPEKDADAVLNEFDSLFSNTWFPVKLASVDHDNSTLLAKWRKDVLRLINANWKYIKCPGCKSNRFSIMPGILMSNAGTICGTVKCKCGHIKTQTLITRCCECSHFPLVIGKNETCTECYGLRCDFRKKSYDEYQYSSSGRYRRYKHYVGEEPQTCGACKCDSKNRNTGGIR